MFNFPSNKTVPMLSYPWIVRILYKRALGHIDHVSIYLYSDYFLAYERWTSENIAYKWVQKRYLQDIKAAHEYVGLFEP